MYERLCERCNNEISKLVLGNTLTTESSENGTQALGTVHKKVEDKVAEADKRYLLDVLNYDMADIFARMGIDTAGGNFCFPEKKEIDPTAKVNILTQIARQFDLPVSDDYLYEEFGIPKPDNYDQLKAAVRTVASAAEEQAGGEDGESTDEDDPAKTGTEPKKNRKLTDRVRDFFGRAPESAGADSDW